MAKEAKILIGIVIASVVGLIVAAFALGGQSQNTAPAVIDESVLVREDSHRIATDSASVTLVEFGDFQCPSCAAAHPIVKQLLDEYGGRVNFVYRHYPLPQHANAQKAAEAVELAGDQDKFWEMFDLLFSRQDEWAQSNRAGEIFAEYAASLGMDADQFRTDLAANKYFDKVFRDKTDGNTLGVNSTPTFFLNATPIVGAPSYNQFKDQIDRLLETD